MRQTIKTPHAPAPIGPYEQAIMVNGFLYVSGQIALDPISGNMLMENIEQETAQVMQNLSAILKAANLGFENVVKTSIFLKDMNNFTNVNEVYGSFFKDAIYPARETVEVARLPKDVNVEISLIAFKHN